MVLRPGLELRREGPIPSGSTTRYYSGMAKKKPKSGPEPEHLKLEGEWEDRAALEAVEAAPVPREGS